MEELERMVEGLQLVLERMQEFEKRTEYEYILEALHLNQRNEPVKREMLERVLEKQDWREIQKLSGSLRGRLHRVTAPLELSPPLEKAIA